MNQHQAKRMAEIVRSARIQQQMSANELANRADVSAGTITRLEKAQILNPQLENLRRIADVLNLPITDLLTVGNWVRRDELPSLPMYLRTKYRGMSADTVNEIERHFDDIARRHGIRLDDTPGPTNGEDE